MAAQSSCGQAAALWPAETAVNNKPVTKLEVGVTYIAYSKKNWSNYTWEYYKIFPGQRILYVSDAAHFPKSRYQHSLDDGGDDYKVIILAENKYRIEGKNLIATKNTRDYNISFNANEDVKAGASEKYFVTTNSGFLVGALEFKNGHYQANTVSLNGYPGNLYRSNIQLPNSMDEYLEQFQLTKTR